MGKPNSKLTLAPGGPARPGRHRCRQLEYSSPARFAPGYIDIVAGCAIGIPGSGGAESAGTENFRQSMGSCVRKELRHEGEKERMGQYKCLPRPCGCKGSENIVYREPSRFRFPEEWRL